MSHTPGPWAWRHKSDSLHRAVADNPNTYGPRVLSLQTDGYGSDAEISEGDANLIAAAPDLLVVAEDLLAWILDAASVELHEEVHTGPCFCESLLPESPPPCGFCSLTRARAAIAKARGES